MSSELDSVVNFLFRITRIIIQKFLMVIILFCSRCEFAGGAGAEPQLQERVPAPAQPDALEPRVLDDARSDSGAAQDLQSAAGAAEAGAAVHRRLGPRHHQTRRLLRPPHPLRHFQGGETHGTTLKLLNLRLLKWLFAFKKQWFYFLNQSGSNFSANFNLNRF